MSEEMLIAERARSSKSKCWDCGKPIPKGDRRLRAKVSGEGWGYIFCKACVAKFIKSWYDQFHAEVNAL